MELALRPGQLGAEWQACVLTGNRLGFLEKPGAVTSIRANCWRGAGRVDLSAFRARADSPSAGGRAARWHIAVVWTGEVCASGRFRARVTSRVAAPRRLSGDMRWRRQSASRSRVERQAQRRSMRRLILAVPRVTTGSGPPVAFDRPLSPVLDVWPKLHVAGFADGKSLCNGRETASRDPRRCDRRESARSGRQACTRRRRW